MIKLTILVSPICAHRFSPRFGGRGGGGGGFRGGSNGFGNRFGGGGAGGMGGRPPLKNSQPGERLRRPKWDMAKLPKFQKDFYQEHPNVASRTMVIIIVYFLIFLVTRHVPKDPNKPDLAKRNWQNTTRPSNTQ